MPHLSVYIVTKKTKGVYNWLFQLIQFVTWINNICFSQNAKQTLTNIIQLVSNEVHDINIVNGDYIWCNDYHHNLDKENLIRIESRCSPLSNPYVHTRLRKPRKSFEEEVLIRNIWEGINSYSPRSSPLSKKCSIVPKLLDLNFILNFIKNGTLESTSKASWGEDGLFEVGLICDADKR